MHCLVFTDTDLYSLTKGKSYLAKQKWRRSTCLRDQCYDVGCHPWSPLHSKWSKLFLTILNAMGFKGAHIIIAFGCSLGHFCHSML